MSTQQQQTANNADHEKQSGPTQDTFLGGNNPDAHAKSGHTAIRRIAGNDPTKQGIANAKAQELVMLGIHDVNELTDGIFWAVCPEMHGKKISAGSPEAKEWIALRDEVAKPALAQAAAHKKDAAKEKSPEEHHAQPAPPLPEKKDASAAHDQKPPSQQPAAHESTPQPKAPAPPTTAAPSGGATTQAGGQSTGGGDKYFAQTQNTYHDNQQHKIGVNKDGSDKMEQSAAAFHAAEGTCNVTSLSMALVSMCDGDESKVRTAVLARLRKEGPPSGATVGAGGKTIALTKTNLADDAIMSQVLLPDLLVAIAAREGSKWDITSPGTLMTIAKELGFAAKEGTKFDGGGSLADPKVRASAKAKLAAGEKLILSTPGHYVYCVAINDDGVVLHDPDGARLTSGLTWLWSAAASNREIGGGAVEHWMSLVHSHAEIAQRRTKLNPEASAMVTRLIAINALKGKEQTEAKNELLKDKTFIEFGKNNFYSLEDCNAMKLVMWVELAQAPKSAA